MNQIEPTHRIKYAGVSPLRVLADDGSPTFQVVLPGCHPFRIIFRSPQSGNLNSKPQPGKDSAKVLPGESLQPNAVNLRMKASKAIA
jgi:hypothetical protein